MGGNESRFINDYRGLGRGRANVEFTKEHGEAAGMPYIRSNARAPISVAVY